MSASFSGIASSAIHIPVDPDSYSEALSTSKVSDWIHAMNNKYLSLLKNETWILDDLPPN
jgi:hypothetical protein